MAPIPCLLACLRDSEMNIASFHCLYLYFYTTINTPLACVDPTAMLPHRRVRSPVLQFSLSSHPPAHYAREAFDVNRAHAHTPTTANYHLSAPYVLSIASTTQVLMTQRRLKHIADSRGLHLRPQDSNAAGGTHGKKVFGTGRKRAARPGVAGGGADALLGAGRRGVGGDPLAKKVKVRNGSTMP